MEKFVLEHYLKSNRGEIGEESPDPGISFTKLCKRIYADFVSEWEASKEDSHTILTLQKNAIIGYAHEVAYFKDKIRALLVKGVSRDQQFPAYYTSLADAIYHENWGLAGIAEWFEAGFRDSSSAKIIGDRIYFLEQGQMVLKPQRIIKSRREQLIRAFLLFTPEERLDKEFHEVYMLDGTRITIFGGLMTKKNQDVIIFRRYIIPAYTFEHQALRGTIPASAIAFFRAMVEVGYNVVFTGAVRTAKTTFLSTWQSYENQSLEGVMVETDPEIPLHLMMKDAPIIQIIADNEKLKHIAKNLLRSDADYFIMAEARDGIALDTLVKIASKGTRRMKSTFHSRDPLDFCYDVAGEIIKIFGGDMDHTAIKAAKSFDYIFHFIQLKNKSQKRLKGIYEMYVDSKTKEIVMTQICSYCFDRDGWNWIYAISEDKRLSGKEENEEAFNRMSEALMMLSKLKEGIVCELS